MEEEIKKVKKYGVERAIIPLTQGCTLSHHQAMDHGVKKDVIEVGAGEQTSIIYREDDRVVYKRDGATDACLKALSDYQKRMQTKAGERMCQASKVSSEEALRKAAEEMFDNAGVQVHKVPNEIEAIIEKIATECGVNVIEDHLSYKDEKKVLNALMEKYSQAVNCALGPKAFEKLATRTYASDESLKEQLAKMSGGCASDFDRSLSQNRLEWKKVKDAALKGSKTKKEFKERVRCTIVGLPKAKREKLFADNVKMSSVDKITEQAKEHKCTKRVEDVSEES